MNWTQSLSVIGLMLMLMVFIFGLYLAINIPSSSSEASIILKIISITGAAIVLLVWLGLMFWLIHDSRVIWGEFDLALVITALFCLITLIMMDRSTIYSNKWYYLFTVMLTFVSVGIGTMPICNDLVLPFNQVTKSEASGYVITGLIKQTNSSYVAIKKATPVKQISQQDLARLEKKGVNVKADKRNFKLKYKYDFKKPITFKLENKLHKIAAEQVLYVATHDKQKKNGYYAYFVNYKLKQKATDVLLNDPLKYDYLAGTDYQAKFNKAVLVIMQNKVNQKPLKMAKLN